MATDLRLKESLPAITERIVETYEECGAIHHLGHSPLPSYREVVEILADLREILYPGYGRRQNLHMGNVAYHVGDLIDSLHDRLTQQIARAFRHDCRAQRPGDRLRGQGPGDRRPVPRDDPRAPRACSPRTSRRPTTATRPPRASTRSSSAIPGVAAITVYRLAHELHRLERAADPPDDDRVRPRQDGHRHPPRRTDRPPVLHRPRHRRRHRRDDRDRRRREDLPGRDPGGAQLPARRVDRRGRSRDTSGTRPSRTRWSSTPTPRSSAADTVIGHHSVIGSSAWITRSVAPYTTVTIENPRLRYRESPDFRSVDDYAERLNYQI